MQPINMPANRQQDKTQSTNCQFVQNRRHIYRDILRIQIGVKTDEIEGKKKIKNVKLQEGDVKVCMRTVEWSENEVKSMKEDKEMKI